MVRRGSRVQVPVTAPQDTSMNLKTLKNNKQKSILILGAACAAVLILVVAGVLLFRSSLQQYHLPPYSFDSQQADLQRFESDIRNMGDEKAYNNLASETSTLSADDQHEYGHLFGDALYKVEGIKGIAVCDSRFSYGCFHQILSDALLKYGSSAVPMLDQKCKQVLKDAYLSCQHGLGHGILVSVGLNKNGYDIAHLMQALTECEKLPDDHPLGGCDGGVYMEYNLRTASNVELDQDTIRPLEQKDFYYPCNQLDSHQQPTCYFWMPQWWAAAGAIRYAANENIGVNKLYQETGGFCDKVPLASSRTCFEGIGYAAVSTAGMNAAQTRNLCKQASSNKLNNLYCRSFAASMIDSVTSDRSTAMAMCEGLSGNAGSFCTAYAKEQGNFFNSLPDPVL